MNAPAPMQTVVSSGSRWHRWDPHIHTPGTILNDQFSGSDVWERYLAGIEAATPTIRALGITDYYGTEGYKQVVVAKEAGRLQQCDLIFPNIEMRLGIGTTGGAWVNIHLLVSPEQPNHLEELDRFLSRLEFPAFGDTFSCTKSDLIRLGKKADSSTAGDDRLSLKKGVEQFKVLLPNLQEVFQGNEWARDNILIAVAGGTSDGTAGVREAADATLRQEIQKFAHVVFASSTAQREFWLGQRADTPEQIRARYGGLKPCLHGCDAHKHADIGMPPENRYCWIKGSPVFDTLRQACIDPGSRAFVGPQPPTGAVPSQTITSVLIGDAAWAATPAIDLNPGLVAIIGARGSGKTALADVIAVGCDAVAEPQSKASFLIRARDLIAGSSVTLTWQAGETANRSLVDGNADAASYPRARYLSQQFVEELCSADGMTDGLMGEIQRVIFESHPLADRDGTVTFDELLDLRATRFRIARQREEEALATLSEQIGKDREKQELLPSIKSQILEKGKAVASYVLDRSKLATPGSEDRIKQLAVLSEAAEKVRGYIRVYTTREQSLLTIRDEIATLRGHQAPEMLRRTKDKHKQSGFDDTQWAAFLLDYKGDVDAAVSDQLQYAQQQALAWRGKPPPPKLDPAQSYLPANEPLEDQALALLDAEINRLQKLVSVDKDTAGKFAAISKKIDEENAAIERLKERLADAEGANDRIKAMQEERDAAYRRIFEAIQSEQDVLTTLYAPLHAKLAAAGKTLQKLTFTVARHVDVDAWAERGESLLDLRVQGAFKGKGSLELLAEKSLTAAWKSGDPDAAAAAMSAFFAEHRLALLQHAPVPKSNPPAFRDWLRQCVHWLYGTDHITLHYSIDYDGVDIRKLSPGTRGIVLLLLYLALDDADDRPLIIDQPEENLDPMSIHDELVPLFLNAKNKRQVILVTHNANLVVNADADQIIVAEAGPHPPGQLPPISYTGGGLEEASIRELVCNILEGGKDAFKERARRLRVALDR